VRLHLLGRGCLPKGQLPRVKLLYDIYHMQIMEGDLIAPFPRQYCYIGHFHTAGNPAAGYGRDPGDHYPAVMQTIAETDYDGYVSHEFIPKAT